MRNDKQKALLLRLEGLSYNQINKKLGVPKSTLSDWLRNVQLSDRANKRIKDRVWNKSVEALIKRNKHQTHLAIERSRSIRNEAKKQIMTIAKRDLFLIGIALYWAEGYKRPKIRDGKIITHHPVSLTNADPNLIKVFLRFLREICDVSDDKIKAGLRIYEHQNAGHLLDFWGRVTGLAVDRFEKFYYGVSKSSLGKRPHNILPYGTIQIRVNNTALYHRIMGWIEGMSDI